MTDVQAQGDQWGTHEGRWPVVRTQRKPGHTLRTVACVHGSEHRAPMPLATGIQVP